MLVEGYKKIMHDLHQNFFQNTFYNKLLKYERFESLNIPRDWVVGMEEHAFKSDAYQRKYKTRLEKAILSVTHTHKHANNIREGIKADRLFCK